MTAEVGPRAAAPYEPAGRARDPYGISDPASAHPPATCAGDLRRTGTNARITHSHGTVREPAITPAVFSWRAGDIFAKLDAASRVRSAAWVEKRRGAAGDGGP